MRRRSFVKTVGQSQCDNGTRLKQKGTRGLKNRKEKKRRRRSSKGTREQTVGAAALEGGMKGGGGVL